MKHGDCCVRKDNKGKGINCNKNRITQIKFKSTLADFLKSLLGWINSKMKFQEMPKLRSERLSKEPLFKYPWKKCMYAPHKSLNQGFSLLHWLKSLMCRYLQKGQNLKAYTLYWWIRFSKFWGHWVLLIKRKLISDIVWYLDRR